MTAHTQSPIDWYPWQLGTFHPQTCGGHWYVNQEPSLTDTKLNAERAYHSTGKYQVVHLHPHGVCIAKLCIAYGRREEIPSLATGAI